MLHPLIDFAFSSNWAIFFAIKRHDRLDNIIERYDGLENIIKRHDRLDNILSRYNTKNIESD